MKHLAVISWIHLSDLHFNSSGAETDLMREKLLEYVSQLSATSPFQYLFLTGDIRNAPEKDYPADVVPFLNRLLTAAHIPQDHLFVVPGNHDITRDSPGRAKVLNCVLKSYDPRVGDINAHDLQLLKGDRDGYLELLRALIPSSRLDCYRGDQPPHFVVQTEHLNVFHLDSTLVYAADHETNLIVGSHFVSRALNDCDPNKPTVILSHYSFDSLLRDEQNVLLAWMKQRHVQLWLAGHEHQDIVRTQRDFFYEIQSGNLHFADRTAPGFVVGRFDLETGSGSFQVHRWNPGVDWALYQTLSDQSDRTRYLFQLQALAVKEQPDPFYQVALRQFEAYHARGGLFHHLRLRQVLLPGIQTDEKLVENLQGELSPLTQVLQDQVGARDWRPLLLLGEGGSGKSCSVLATWKHLLENGMLTLYLPLHELTEDGPSVEARLEALLGQPLSIVVQARHILLILDGFNEQRPKCIQRTIQSIRNLMGLTGLKLLVTSRFDFRDIYGLRELCLVQTRPLSDAQLELLLSTASAGHKALSPNLRRLVRNPMMALLYFDTSAEALHYRDIHWVAWRTEIGCAEDLLWNFFQIQCACVLFQGCSFDEIFQRRFVVDYVLPGIAALTEVQGTIELTEDELEGFITTVLEQFHQQWGTGLPPALRRMRRDFAIQTELPDGDDVYRILTCQLHFLVQNKSFYAFPHQIFRDYLAARHLVSCFTESNEVPMAWRRRLFPENVLCSLRNLIPDPWAEKGIANRLLSTCRGQDAALDDRLLENTLNCWFSVDCPNDQIRDLSGLDLRNFSLVPYLQSPLRGKTSLIDAKVTQDTFTAAQEHDAIYDIACSEDGRFLAFVSHNGLFSLYDRDTGLKFSLERLIGRCERLLFAPSGQLLAKVNGLWRRWGTEPMGIYLGAVESEAIADPAVTPMPTRIQQFLAVLNSEKMTGTVYAFTEDGQFLAVGKSDGSVELWDCEAQNIALHIQAGIRRPVCAAVSLDGQWLAIGAGGSLVQIWDLIKRHCCGCAHLSQPVTDLQFNQNDHPELLLCLFADQSGIAYDCAAMALHPDKTQFAQKAYFNRSKIEKTAKISLISRLDQSPSGSAVALASDGSCMVTWNQAIRKGYRHDKIQQPIVDAALCHSDDRFAASYSGEIISGRELRDASPSRKSVLAGKRVVRVWHTGTGKLIIRLPISGQKLKAIRFFSNGIQLVGFAQDDSILVWELKNEHWYGGTREVGRWSAKPTIVPGRSQLPLECALLQDYYKFVLIYPDASVVIWDLKKRTQENFQTIPGISFDGLDCSNVHGPPDVQELLRTYCDEHTANDNS